MTGQVFVLPRMQKLHSQVFSYQKEKSEGLEKLPTPKGLVLAIFLIEKTIFWRYINQKHTVEMRTPVIHVKTRKNPKTAQKLATADAQCSDNIHCGGILQQTELWDRNGSFFHACKVWTHISIFVHCVLAQWSLPTLASPASRFSGCSWASCNDNSVNSFFWRPWLFILQLCPHLWLSEPCQL